VIRFQAPFPRCFNKSNGKALIPTFMKSSIPKCILLGFNDKTIKGYVKIWKEELLMSKIIMLCPVKDLHPATQALKEVYRNLHDLPWSIRITASRR
jgi:hypothetical protein